MGRFELVFSEESTLTDDPVQKPTDFEIFYASKRDKIVISNPMGLLIEEVEVYNILGQSVKRFTIEQQQTYYELPFYNIQAATYVVHVRTGEGVKTKKFIVDGLRD
jgi:hypothetical protein